MARVAVLASGEGTNLQALLDDPAVGPRVVLVVSDRVEARALRRAANAGVMTEVVERDGFEDRDSFDSALVAALREHHVDTVVLAGFMRVLGPGFVRAFPNRILNVHPALLPSFPGAHGVADALGYGVKVTGVTVHLVDEGMDTGPIVFQEAIAVGSGDAWDSVEERIHAAEHRLLPRAVEALIEDRIVVDGRIVHVKEES